MKILFAYLSKRGGCPRANRFEKLLGPNAQVTHYCCSDTIVTEGTIGIANQQSSILAKIYLFILLLLGKYKLYLKKKNFSNVETNLKGVSFDVVVCFDLLLLPALLESNLIGKVVLDAREYYPRQFEDDSIWRVSFGRLYHWICQMYLSELDSKMTVSEGVASLYLKNYSTTFSVVPSFAEFHEMQPKYSNLEDIRLVHHGVANPNRQIELMIFAVQLLPISYTLDLYLVETSSRYFKYLKNLVGKSERVRILQPVPSDEIVLMLSDYDIGLFVPTDSTINLKYSLPNKIYEYIQARLAVVVTPLDSVSKLVKDESIGVVSKGFSAKDISEAVSSLTLRKLEACKHNCDRHARKYSSDAHKSLFLSLL